MRARCLGGFEERSPRKDKSGDRSRNGNKRSSASPKRAHCIDGTVREVGKATAGRRRAGGEMEETQQTLRATGSLP
eukprot:scaffold4937_cov105-Isochrysis_galbana.AAC.1